MRKAVALALGLFAVGCGDDGGNNPGLDAPVIDAPMPDAYVPPADFTKLIGRTWNLTAGQLDTYRCVRVTLTQDTYITNIVAQAPSGTHHTVLSIAGSNGTAGPDGEYNCDVGELGMQMLYASGVGTSPLDFPTDVGVKIAAGQQIHLNLHLFNATDNALSGESAIYVKSQSTPPPILAEMVFAGKFGINIPPGSPTNTTPHVVSGKACDVTNDNFSLFAVWPHMHQLATHQKVTLVRNGATTVLHDLPYSFGEQTYYKKDPIVQVMDGDTINIACTYVNTTTTNVTFGDSSNKEMCFVGMYRYPAANAGLFACTDTMGFGI